MHFFMNSLYSASTLEIKFFVSKRVAWCDTLEFATPEAAPFATPLLLFAGALGIVTGGAVVLFTGAAPFLSYNKFYSSSFYFFETNFSISFFH